MCILRTLIAFILSLTIISICSSAPAPLPKKVQKPNTSLIGVWLMQWGGCNYLTYLDLCGCYRIVNTNTYETTWKGTWKYEDGTLHVNESLNNASYNWSVNLDNELSGRLSSGTEVKLNRR